VASEPLDVGYGGEAGMNGIYANDAFSEPVYGCFVAVVVGKTLKDCKRAQPRLYGDYDPRYNAVASCIFSDDCKAMLTFVRKHLNIGVVAHEVFHLTHLLMDRRGVDYHIDHDEPFAILNEYLFNETWKIVGRHCK
jgi:hypothetical protein